MTRARLREWLFEQGEKYSHGEIGAPDLMACSKYAEVMLRLQDPPVIEFEVPAPPVQRGGDDFRADVGKAD